MKLVDIDECDRKVFYKELGTKDGRDVCLFAEDVFNMLEALPPVNAIPIPEGATNGDILKAIFPNLQNEEKAFAIHVYVNKNKVGEITMDWWNTPYKK